MPDRRNVSMTCNFEAQQCLDRTVITAFRYRDTDPILDVCINAQRYYEQHSYNTEVKAASLLTAEEVVQLVGVASITIPPPLLEDLSKLEEPASQLAERSLFVGEPRDKEFMERVSFIDDEEKYRKALRKRGNGKAERNIAQVQRNLF